jgi:RHS repeat-associated protein
VQGQILAQDEAGAWGYVLPDHLGSVRQVIDAAGQVTLAQSYDPFGNLNSQHGTQNPQLPFGYTGEWYESYTQLLFLQARYCDPAVGRLLSKDPWMGDPVRPQSLRGAVMFPQAERFDRWPRHRSPHTVTHVHYTNDLKLFFAWAACAKGASSFVLGSSLGYN